MKNNILGPLWNTWWIFYQLLLLHIYNALILFNFQPIIYPNLLCQGNNYIGRKKCIKNIVYSPQTWDNLIGVRKLALMSNIIMRNLFLIWLVPNWNSNSWLHRMQIYYDIIGNVATCWTLIFGKKYYFLCFSNRKMLSNRAFKSKCLKRKI